MNPLISKLGLITLLAMSGPAMSQEADLGPVERLDGIAACVAYLDALPQDRVKLVRLNGHLALTRPDPRFGWVVDMDSAKQWCRYGVNRIRVDVWEDGAAPTDPYAIF